MPTSALRVSDYLKQRPAWRPALDDTLRLLDSTAGASLLPLNPFGPLGHLAAQLTKQPIASPLASAPCSDRRSSQRRSTSCSSAPKGRPPWRYTTCRYANPN